MWIIKDWADNHLFQDRQFESFEDGWDFLFDFFSENNMDCDEWAQEYGVYEINEDGTIA
jgi:hypothetical protein